uniref:Uncharacterized protein n=1 Tax=Amphimedon queenslandica TaxID=400682 RepID=A0A1X7THW2_AMPQE
LGAIYEKGNHAVKYLRAVNFPDLMGNIYF